MKEKDSIDKLNEQIRKLEKKEEIIEKNNSDTTRVFDTVDEDTDTKIFDIEDTIVDSKTAEIELLDDLLETKKTEIKEDKKVEKKVIDVPKKSKKKIIIISLIISIMIVVGILITVFLLLNNDENIDDDIKENVKLTEKQQEELLKRYGEALEEVINIQYIKNERLIEYDDAVKFVKFDDEINCLTHEIYKDGKIYLNKCSINGINVKFYYGQKQEEKISEDELLYVYVDKKNRKSSLEKPKGTTYDVYTVHCGGKYSDPEILNEYVIFFDNEYKIRMKNYKTDEVVLSNLNYQEIWPIKRLNYGYDSTYLLVKINNFWGVYNFITGEQVISPRYTNFLCSVGGSASSAKAVQSIGDNLVVAWDGNKYGVIEYTSNKNIIPFDYLMIGLSGDYIYAIEENGFSHIYDNAGKRYLENTFDNVYSIVDGKYVLVNDKDEIKIVTVTGKSIWNYGKIWNIGDYSYGIFYNNQTVFQFSNSSSNETCLEFVYDVATSKGSFKDNVCGGIGLSR